MRHPSAHRSTPAVLRVLAASLVAAFGHAPGLALAQTPAQVLPTGVQVTGGEASFVTAGGKMTITNSRNAVLDWQSFSIGAENGVHFQQPDAGSKVLNRVVGNDLSTIAGGLSSNGAVWLVNPHGVLFGAGARIDVGSLVASSLGVSNQDFIAGRNRFDSAGAPGAAVINQSNIVTSFGGRVWLVGGSVSNNAIIDTRGGSIVLAAGQSIELVDSGLPNVTVRVSAPDNSAVNLGTLLARDGGSIDLHGAIVNQSGIVHAGSIETGASGSIVLHARDSLQIGADSVTSVEAFDGASGGVIKATSDGDVSIAGSLAAGSAHGRGGAIVVSGRDVTVDGGNRLDASGNNGGGALDITGRTIRIGSGAMVSANAWEEGPGGTVLLRADGATRIHGRVEARGGGAGGDGGRIETVGALLDLDGAAVAADSPSERGNGGSWLLQADTLRVIEGNGDGRDSPPLAQARGESVVTNGALGSALASGTRVTLSATGAQSGDVVVGATIMPVGSQPGAALTLAAHNDVVLEPGAGIVAEGGSMPVVLRGDADRNGIGAIRIGEEVQIYTGEGDLRLEAPDIEVRPGSMYVGGNIAIAADDVTLDGANMQAWGKVRIDGARSIVMNNARVVSETTGNAIELASASVTASGESRLQTPAGRWLVYLDSIDAAFSATQYGQLGYTFVEVGAGAGDWSTDRQEGRSGVVVRAGLDARLHVNADRTYDGTSGARFSEVQSSNLGPAFVLTGGGIPVEGAFADKHAGNGKRIVTTQGDVFGLSTATGVPVYGATQTYVADIARKEVTAIEVAAANKVYDATRVAILSGSVNGVLSGDDATLNGAHGRFDDKHAGAGKTVTIAGATLAGADGRNYRVVGPAVQADILVRALGDGAMTALDKVYDGARDASLAQAVGGILAGDDVHLGGASASFDDRHAGAGKTVSVSGAFLAGADAANYRLDPSATLRATITQRQLQANGVTAQDKVYDGATTATVSASLAGMVEGDDVRVDGLTGAFSDKHAGSGKTVIVSGARLAGADAGNYAFSAPASVRASITPRPIAAGALAVQDKVYDGTRNASVAATLSGIVAGDNVRLDGATGLFADKNAGAGKTVTLSGGALAGADAANYTLGSGAGNGAVTGSASITPRALGATGLAAQDKVYDGTRDATLSGTLTGVLAGDSVSLDGATGAFADKHAGSGKVVTVSGAALGGADARNYTLDVGAATVRADITPKAISVTGMTARDKVYDGSRAADVSGMLAGTVAGDAVAYEASGQFDSKNVGSGRQVAITGGLRGADAANYTLSAPTVASASITHRELDIVIQGPVSKEYDATTAIGLAPDAFALRGVVAGEMLAVRGPAQGSFDTRDAGRDKGVSASGVFEILGADAANYRIGATGLAGGSNRVQATATGAGGTITPATLVYDANRGTFVGGLAVGGLGGAVTGFKGNDTLANATTGALQWHSTATPGAAPGAHPIFGSGLSAANYVLVQAPGNATALDIKPGIPAGGPQQRAQDAGTQAIASGLETVLPKLEAATVAGALFDRSSPAAAHVFGPVQVNAMSQNELAQMLAQRRDFKRKLFADAVYKLSIDPSLADVRACDSAAEAASAMCRVTPAQLALLHATQAQAAVAQARHAHASVPQIERKIALLIGIDAYTDKEIPQLKNAIRDADTVGDLFAKKLGYEVRVARNPDKAEIIRLFNALAAEAGSADSVVIYYAGHGFSLEANGAGYWIPSDGDATDPKGWISNSDVAHFLAGIRSKQVTLISDSCYSGAFAREGLAAVGRNVTVDDVLAKRSVVVLSSGGDEPVPDNGRKGHSIFAWTLMQVMDKVESWTPGSSVFADVQAAVKKEFPQTPKYGSVTAAGHQAGGDYLFESRSN